MADRFLHTFDEWMTRVNKRLTQLERRKPFSGGSATVPDPLIVNQLQVTGHAVVPTPNLDEEAANKGYVDQVVADGVEQATQHLVAGTGVTVTGAGTSGDPWVVSAAGTAPTLEFAAGARYTEVVQSIPSGTATSVVLESTDHLTGGVTAASGGLVVPVQGWYVVTGSWAWESNSTGYRAVELFLNDVSGSAGLIASDRRGAPSGSNSAVTVSQQCYLQAGDLIKMRVHHNVGAALVSNPTSQPIRLSVMSQGPV